MKLCYAFRRGTFYPFMAGSAWDIPKDPKTRTEYLGKVNDIGFDGIELGFDAFGGFGATRRGAKEFQSVLADAGTPCVAIRAGGGLCQPSVAAESRRRLEKAVEIAGWIDADIVNTALGSPPRDATLDTGLSGERSSHGSSALATEEDFVRTAAVLRSVGAMAGDVRNRHYDRGPPTFNRRQLLVNAASAGAHRQSARLRQPRSGQRALDIRRARGDV